MLTVHKYVLDFTDYAYFEAPVGAEPLRVDMQDWVLCLWARVDTSKPMVMQRVLLRGTGHPFTGKEGDYVNSFQLDRIPPLIFHVFKERQANDV
jgi:hypothetical protein